MKALISQERWAAIRLFAMDVDGILTDGTIHVSSDGVETKTFSILDGMGLVQLRKHGIPTAWISGRASGATSVRAEELKIPHLVQGRTDKITALKELAATLNLTADQIVYMGDDNIDTAAIQWADSPAQTVTPKVKPSAPVKNLTIPTFDKAGKRETFMKADEALFISTNHIEVKNMNFTLFTKC